MSITHPNGVGSLVANNAACLVVALPSTFEQPSIWPILSWSSAVESSGSARWDLGAQKSTARTAGAHLLNDRRYRI